MGWNIRNAWRLPADADPFAEIASLRQAVVPAQLLADAQEIADTAVSLVDRFCLHGDVCRLPMRGDDTPVNPHWPWVSAVGVLAHQESKISQMRAGTDRHRCEIQFIRDFDDGRVYAICYADDRDIRQAATEAMIARDWQDWTPSGSEPSVWDKIVGHRTPAEVGLGLSIKPVGKFGTTPALMGMTDAENEAMDQVRIHTVDERLSRMALDVYFSRFASGDASQAMSVLMDATDRIDSLIGSPGWDRLRSQMVDLSLADVREHRDSPVASHRLSEDDIAEVLAGGPSLSSGDSTNTD